MLGPTLGRTACASVGLLAHFSLSPDEWTRLITDIQRCHFRTGELQNVCSQQKFSPRQSKKKMNYSCIRDVHYFTRAKPVNFRAGEEGLTLHRIARNHSGLLLSLSGDEF